MSDAEMWTAMTKPERANREGDFVYLCWSRMDDTVIVSAVIETEQAAEAWRIAVDRGVRWWEMWEVGQPFQGRLDQSEEAHGQ